MQILPGGGRFFTRSSNLVCTTQYFFRRLCKVHYGHLWNMYMYSCIMERVAWLKFECARVQSEGRKSGSAYPGQYVRHSQRFSDRKQLTDVPQSHSNIWLRKLATTKAKTKQNLVPKMSRPCCQRMLIFVVKSFYWKYAYSRSTDCRELHCIRNSFYILQFLITRCMSGPKAFIYFAVRTNGAGLGLDLCDCHTT